MNIFLVFLFLGCPVFILITSVIRSIKEETGWAQKLYMVSLFLSAPLVLAALENLRASPHGSVGSALAALISVPIFLVGTVVFLTASFKRKFLSPWPEIISLLVSGGAIFIATLV